MAEQSQSQRISIILVARPGKDAAVPAREQLEKPIARAFGRIVRATPAGVVAEFASVTEAVGTAAELRGGGLRIGINVGPVTGEGEAVAGDGVSVAERLAALAEPGGIVLAQSATAPIAAKYRLDPIDGAAFHLRLDQPAPAPAKPPRPAIAWKWPAAAVLALVVLGAGTYAYVERPWEDRATPAVASRMAYPLPERPSLGVLVFDNVSGDAQQDSMADGIAENIIASLSKIRDVFVISRSSTFGYKGKSPTIAQVAEELGIRYVVDGKLRQVGNTLQVDARLTDAVSGRYLWAEHYERDPHEIFAIGDQIAMSVIGKVGVTLTRERRDLALQRETDSLEAWLLWRAAETLRANLTLENIQSARKLLQQALQLDPKYIAAMTAMAQGYVAEARSFPRANVPQLLAAAADLLDKAADMDETRAQTRAGFTNYYISRGDLDRALPQAEKAVTLDPNEWSTRAQLGLILHRLNRDTDALPHLRIAQRLNPGMPNEQRAVLGRALMGANQPNQALATFEQILRHEPSTVDTFTINAWMAVIYMEAGDEAKARERLKTATDVRPDLTVAYFRQNYPFKDIAQTHNRWAAAWRKLGMPER